MKRIISFVLALTMTLTLCACGSSPTDEPSSEVKEPAAVLQKVPVLDGFTIDWLDSSTHHQVGEDISINEAGQIIKYESQSRSDEYSFSYNESGAMTTVTNASNGNELKTFTYTDGQLTGFVYDLKDGFSARQNAVIELQKGDNGSVTAAIENTTYTSAKDGSVKQRINKRTYEYGDNGEITASTYSSDGKVDHITTFTYDENGNILCYSNADPKTGKVYLKVTFTYTMADKDSVTEIDVDSFTTVYNWETIINFIL